MLIASSLLAVMVVVGARLAMLRSEYFRERMKDYPLLPPGL